jgi:hypothetical protein
MTDTQMTKMEIFAKNSNDKNGVSLVIPRVFPNWNYYKIKNIFIQCGWGYVERVDVVPVGRIPKGRFKTAFVHMRPGSWNFSDKEASDVLRVLSEGPQNHVKVVNDTSGPEETGGWFWKVLISSAIRPDEAPKAVPRPMVTLGDDSSTSVASSDIVDDMPAEQDYEPISPTYSPDDAIPPVYTPLNRMTTGVE